MPRTAARLERAQPRVRSRTAKLTYANEKGRDDRESGVNRGRTSDEAIEARLQELRQTAREYGAAAGERARLEEFRKAKVAMLMKDAEKAGHKTAAAQEREAHADPEYHQLLTGLGDCGGGGRSRLKWELKIAELGVSLWQTQTGERTRWTQAGLRQRLVNQEDRKER
jgi:hypothetical protein